MANYVTIYKTVNGCDLLINGLVAKSTFTDTSFPAIMTEVDAYLNSTEGQERLSGNFTNLFVSDITYVCDGDRTSFDGTNNVYIKYIDKTKSPQ